MTELRKKINNLVEDYNACKVLAESVENPNVYEGTTATSSDIVFGKTAYSNGKLIEGELLAGNTIVSTTWTAGTTVSPIVQSLKRIDGKIVVSGTSMQSFFRDCINLEAAPDMDTSNVTNMNFVCMGCHSITSIPRWNTSKVTEWNYAFSSCKLLKSIPDFDTSATTTFSNMFTSCTSLETAPAFDTKNGKVFSAMFQNCTGLKNVPQYNFSGIVWRQTNALQDMFKGCTSLSDDALNNIMASLMTANALESFANRSLSYVGLTQAQAERCMTLPKWAEFSAAGLITGY